MSVKQSDKVTAELKENNKTKRNSVTFDIKKGVSVYLKILLNYLQMISIIESLKLKWPAYLQNFLNVHSNIGGGVSTEALSLECFLQDQNILTNVIYVQTLLKLILPFAICFVSIIILIQRFRKERKKQINRSIVVLIIVSIFFQPSIIKSLFDNVTCEKIEENLYLKTDLLIDCESDSQQKWVNYIFLFSFKKFLEWNRDLSLHGVLDINLSWNLSILYDLSQKEITRR